MLNERPPMPTEKASLLIVDDDVSIRNSLAVILGEAGYRVRSTADGFSALVELRSGMPDIILLRPQYAGYVWLRIAFGGTPQISFDPANRHERDVSGDGVPPGVAADAFYEKGTNLGSLLQIMEAMARSERQLAFQPSSLMAPIWIPKNGHDPSGEAFVVITCPECLRTFSQTFDKAKCSIRETSCVYCQSLIHYAIVQPTDPVSQQVFQRKPGAGMPTPLSVPDTN